jgi:hypothetical protein
MRERWKQVYRKGEAGLYPFTRAELAAVTLDPEALPEADRGPFLQVTEAAAGATAGPTARPTAGTVARLERLGFLRPGQAVPATGGTPTELAGWAAGPGGPGTRQPVALLGDLAIVTRIRAQPVWVAEVTVSPEPARAGPATDGWPVLARVYAPYRPPVRLVEQPVGTQGGLPPYVLLRDDRAVRALVGWCGADVTVGMGGRAGDFTGAGLPIPMPTAEVSGAFAALTQLRVAVTHERSVLLRTLVVATGYGSHWLLEGDRRQRAVPVSAGGLGQRIAALLRC